MTAPLLDLPANVTLPFFAYGALRPGMPAFERLRPFVRASIQRDRVEGELFVRDGLPLLFPSQQGQTDGFLLAWNPGREEEGYRSICEFEPRKQYEWAEITVLSGVPANVLVGRFPHKGNPQPLDSPVWRLTDDPAFGEGLAVVREATAEIAANTHWTEWQRFFRAQMAYLLLWSVLERLSALCIGPNHDPHERINRLYELPGMADLVASHVRRSDRVADSRDPSHSYKLEADNPKKCFQYYYQVRSNLSHRGKGVWNEFGKVHDSLRELLSIAEQYVKRLRDQELQA
jgi:hypothetical protein